MLVIHCTDTLPGREVTAKEIRSWHCSPIAQGGRGWKQVGYSDMIHLDGKVENLVPYDNDEWVEPNEITNGAAGYNACSRHVVYVGGRGFDGKAKDTRTDAQKKALAEYVQAFKAKYPKAKVVGHNELSGKACPSFDVRAWLKETGIK